MKRPLVYDYLDYRAFLADMYQFRKQCGVHFSYRWFSQKSGFSSPNYLQLVINGKRNLTNTSIAKIAKGFGLKRREREFFENLVFMNQADTGEEKNHYYLKMLSVTQKNNVRTLEEDQYEYFSKWYYPAVREIVGCENADITPEGIAARLEPAITAQEVRSALKLLHRLKLVK